MGLNACASRPNEQGGSAPTTSENKSSVRSSNQWKWERFVRISTDVYGEHVGKVLRGEEGVPSRSFLEALPGAAGRGVTEREMGFRASAFLFRKVMTSGSTDKAQAALDYLAKMGRGDVEDHTPTEEQEFKEEVKGVLKDYFWKFDRDYNLQAAVTNPSDGACLEGRSSRVVLQGRYEWGEWVRELTEALDGHDGIRLNPDRKVVVLEDGGKTRTVTIGTCELNRLRALHVTVYDALVRSGVVVKDLNVRDLTERFSDPPGPEEEFCSGDYTAATDDFRMWRGRVILETLLEGCQTEAARLAVKLAMDIFRPGRLYATVGDELREGARLTGQLMGDLMSFPLLCLSNLVAFRGGIGRDRAREIEGWDGRRRYRKSQVLINGDDIVFRAGKPEILRWMENVKNFGLRISPGKTTVHPRMFSLNSTYFAWSSRKVDEGKRRGHVRRLNLVRAKTVCKDSESLWGVLESVRENVRNRGLYQKVARYLLRVNVRCITPDGAGCRPGGPADPLTRGFLKGRWRRFASENKYGGTLYHPLKTTSFRNPVVDVGPGVAVSVKKDPCRKYARILEAASRWGSREEVVSKERRWKEMADPRPVGIDMRDYRRNVICSVRLALNGKTGTIPSLTPTATTSRTLLYGETKGRARSFMGKLTDLRSNPNRFGLGYSPPKPVWVGEEEVEARGVFDSLALGEKRRLASLGFVKAACKSVPAKAAAPGSGKDKGPKG